VSERISAGLANEGSGRERIVIDATYLKANRTAASLWKKGCSRCTGRTKSWLNSKPHAVCDEQGRPMILLLTEAR
jgi:hypothetical protein